MNLSIYICRMGKYRKFKIVGLLAIALLCPDITEAAPPVVSSTIGEKVVAVDSSLTITCVDRRGRRHTGEHYDADISSPKSVTFSADGKKLYVNSLEGGATVVYDAVTRNKLKVISHKFPNGNGTGWLKPSGYYEFTHYPGGESRAFMGKPVEKAISRDGKWLFMPYYRRSFDLNAQDPSALAVIDTRTDSIVMMVETGPLPKMVRVSNDGKLLAITHWGDNTVGFLDISSGYPREWRHLPPVAIGTKLKLNYSLTNSVNRDSGSGFLLRGTQFLPGDSLLLVSGMAGPMAVIDVKRVEWIGMFEQLQSVRHIAMSNGMLFFSRNTAGEALSVPVDSMVKAIAEQRKAGRKFRVKGVGTVKVGAGARTLKPGPSGRYLFVACNSASALYVVRTADMKVIASIPVDSYPVGLDVSADGSMVAVTSQGRDGSGGNAVNFFAVDYREAEPVKTMGEASSGLVSEADTLDFEAIPVADDVAGPDETWHPERVCMAVGAAAVCAMVIFIMARRRRKKK